MGSPDAAALAGVTALLRQLRDIKGLKETRPGQFELNGSPFIRLQDENGTLVAELKKSGGSGFDRYPVDAPTGQRKLVDDARRRIARSEED